MKNVSLIMSILLTSCISEVLQWQTSESLPSYEDGSTHIGLAGPVTGIIDSKLIIAGGANFPDKKPWEGGAKVYQDAAYIYSIINDKLELLQQTTLEGIPSYAGNCTIGNLLYVAGGETSDGPTSRFFSLTFNDKITLIQTELPPLPLPLTNGSLVTQDQKLYFIGGENKEIVSDKIYAFDLKSQAWQETLTLPYPVTNAIVLANQRDKIYIAGGRMRNMGATSTIYDQILEVNLKSGKITGIGTLPKAAAAGTGVITEKGNLLFFGGDTAETFHKVETLIAQANNAASEDEKKRINTEKAGVLSDHPGFTKKCWEFNPQTKSWKELEPIADESPVTTSALLYHNLIIIPSGEIRAGVRTPQILLGTLK